MLTDTVPPGYFAPEITTAGSATLSGAPDAGTEALLSLFSDSADGEQVAESDENTDEAAKTPAPAAPVPSQPAEPDFTSVSEITASREQAEGTAFLDWLRAGIAAGTTGINGVNDKLHTVAGCVFLPVPGIFFEYLKSTGQEAANEQREALQASFEALNRHKKRNNRRFYFGRLYEKPGCGGKFTALKGYLIKGSILYGSAIPADSQYFSVDSGADHKNRQPP